jgi:hypothetical protein
MIEPLELQAVQMTEPVMQRLEDRNLIIRLCPNRHELPVRHGEALGKSVYESDIRHGAHKLIAVTLNRSSFATFGTHPDNEDFLLIGDPGTKPLYLAIALHRKEELDRRIAEHELTADDFVCLRVKFNDPNVSFFTMLADVPHGEAVADMDGRPASFYVTEPCDLGRELTSFGRYALCLPQIMGNNAPN